MRVVQGLPFYEVKDDKNLTLSSSVVESHADAIVAAINDAGRMRKALVQLLGDVERSKEIIFDHADDAFGINASIDQARTAQCVRSRN